MSRLTHTVLSASARTAAAARGWVTAAATRRAAILAAGALLTAGSARGHMSYSGTYTILGGVAGSYTLHCADGSYIRGNFTGPGSRSCPDGSNSLSWHGSFFDGLVFDEVDNKSQGGTSTVQARGQLSPDGHSLMISGQVIQPDGFLTQVAVLLVPQNAIPPDFTGTVQDLISSHILVSQQVVYVRELDNAFAGPINQVITFPQPADPNRLVVFVHSAPLDNPCPVDLNGDGLVDVRDFLQFMQLYAAGNPGADTNGDGVVNVADFLDFLRLYSAGCQ